MNEPRETYGRLFWLSLVAGWALIGFGLLVLVQRRGATHPVSFAVYVLGGIVAHDLVLVPVVMALGVLAARGLPAGVRGPVQGGLLVSGIVVLTSGPMVGGFGRLADNPSLLPRDYASSLLLVAAAVWAVVAAMVAVRHVRRLRRLRRVRHDEHPGAGGT